MVGLAEVMRVRTPLGERGEKEVSVWVKGGSRDPAVSKGESGDPAVSKGGSGDPAVSKGGSGDPAVSKGESEKEERISTFFSK